MRAGYSKYHSRKVTRDGLTFDSVKEYRYYLKLKEMEAAGTIQNLERQVKYVLIPAQREAPTEVFKRGPRKGQYKEGRIIEKACVYIADFTYTCADGQKIVVDTKGVRTPDYIIKRKLMLWIHGIRISEV